jgi:hypothetical protein
LQTGMGKGGPVVVICQIFYQLLIAGFHLKVDLAETYPRSIDHTQVIAHAIYKSYLYHPCPLFLLFCPANAERLPAVFR